VNRNPQNAERQKHQPHQGIGNQGEQSNWPANKKENAPEEESDHGKASECFLVDFTKFAAKKFPAVYLGWELFC